MRSRVRRARATVRRPVTQVVVSAVRTATAIIVGTIFALMGLLGMFSGASWDGWRAILKVIVGAHLSDSDLAFYQQVTGRTSRPAGPFREMWFIVGRRAGKSIIVALQTVYQTCCKTYTLAAGEIGVFVVLSATKYQARVIFSYIVAMLVILGQYDEQPLTDGEPTSTEIVLRNGLRIEIHAASFRSLRGYTVIGAACDEVAYWQSDDSANPDTEILNALRPAMATVPNAVLMCITSPHARRGEVWRIYSKHFGKDDSDVLVVQASSRTLNPALSQAVIDRAYADDPALAAAEYGGLFRSDLEDYVTREALEAVVVPGRLVLPPLYGARHLAFVDPSGSGGATADSFAAAVAHWENDRVVLDAIYEKRPPFSPEDTVAELAAWLKRYGVTEVGGDRYAGQWPAEQFRKHGIGYRPSEASKSDLYREFLPIVTSGRVQLLDHPKLLAQLASLERRISRGGRESIDHPQGSGSHDDVANVVAGVCAMADAGVDGPSLIATICAKSNETPREQFARLQAAAEAGARRAVAPKPIDARLALLVHRHGSEAVEIIRRSTQPDFTLPEELRGIAAHR
jgi:hypothetical protein